MSKMIDVADIGIHAVQVPVVYGRNRPVSRSVTCCFVLLTLFANTLAFGRIVPERDPRDGALDASLIVLVRQQEPEVFQIEEVFLGDSEAGATIRLPKFRLYTIQQFGQEKVDTITPQTHILLFLKPKKEAPETWQILGYGHCYFWVHDPAKVGELRKMAQDVVNLRNSWEKARNIPDPWQRVEALWPFLWEKNGRVTRLTSEELQKTTPVAGDFIAERFDRLSDRERQRLVLDAASYDGKKLHDVLRSYLQDLQRRYEQFLKNRGPGADNLIEKWNEAPQEVKEIWGCLYYGLAGLVSFKNRDDLPYIRELTAWAIKYRFKQTCDAALKGFQTMPDKANLPLIDAIWKEFSRRPYEGNTLNEHDVAWALYAHRYPEAVPILAPLLEYDSVRLEVHHNLKKIVGQNLGDRPQAWLDWWYKQRSKPPAVRKAAATKETFHDVEKHDLSGFWGMSMGDIGGKKLNDILAGSAITRAIVLANHTNAPNSVHLFRVARLIESNPTIESIWMKDKTSGQKKWDSSYDNLTPFFAVLLEDKNNRITGLLFFIRDKEEMVKVVSEAGVGVVKIVAARKNDSADLKPTSANTDQSQGHRVTALQPPMKLDELIVWRDGGSLGFRLSDASGQHLTFCVDHKIKSPTAGNFFFNVTHADQEGGQKLDLGGDAEKQLISYLQSWLETNFTQAQQTNLLQREKDVDKLTKPEFNAWHVLRLVDNWANVIQRIREQEKVQ